MLKRFILKFFGDFIAKVYISIFKKAIDNYENKTQLSKSNIAKTVVFYGKGTVYFSEKLVIKDYCRIGENFFIHSKGGVTIGINTILSRNVTIYSANHNYKSEKKIPYDNTYIEKPVIIGESVWIGMNVCILPGVNVGDGAIIGMGSIISKDVKEGEIVVSNSQRTISKRDIKVFNRLKKEKQYYGKFFN
jgi:acetyltransferase-like isoleucine patch superfamily enzyme